MSDQASYFNNCFPEWLKGVLGVARPYLQNFLKVVPDTARFGGNVSSIHNRHNFMKRSVSYLLLLYWRAWEHNTWYATTDTEGCRQVLPLGSFITDQTIACWLREGDCVGIDIRPLLRAAGVRPLPDGISVMQINGTGDCMGIIFQVGRERRIDIAPQPAPPLL